MHQVINFRSLRALSFSLALLGSCNALASTNTAKPTGSVFAVVNGFEVPRAVYIQAVRNEIRSKYYHGKVSDDQYKKLLEEVSQRLIDNVLLMLEAERQGLIVESIMIDNKVLAYSNQLKHLPKDESKRMMMRFRKQLESREKIRMLEMNVRDQVQVSESMAVQFYNLNPNLFLVPLKRKVSLILIEVAPNSLSPKWNEAESLLKQIRERIVNKESFSEIAKAYSDDETASKGGDMGFLHEGMLSEEVELVLKSLKEKEISHPIRLLEGFALVRLEDIKESTIMPYQTQVKKVHRILSSKLADEAWSKFIKELRVGASIVESNLVSKMLNR